MSNPSSHPSEPSKNAFLDTSQAGEMLSDSYLDLSTALSKAIQGISSRIHQIDQDVTFILDGHQEVRLRVKKIEILYQGGSVLDFKVHCRTNFENVLILAQKINMRIAAFSTFFSVTLQGHPDFVEDWNDSILELLQPADFFETMDVIKKPLFLNLDYYIFSRISK